MSTARRPGAVPRARDWRQHGGPGGAPRRRPWADCLLAAVLGIALAGALFLSLST